ncbi:hypothetical protein AHAS_Ahas12G0121800 [Arachis hypogaea]
MHERKSIMAKHADAFIALPGLLIGIIHYFILLLTFIARINWMDKAAKAQTLICAQVQEGHGSDGGNHRAVRKADKVVSGIALPFGSDKLYTASIDETLRVWDYQFGQCTAEINVGGEVGCMINEGPWIFVGIPNCTMVQDQPCTSHRCHKPMTKNPKPKISYPFNIVL